MKESIGQNQASNTAASITKACYIKTYGCQMNVYDSERMAEALTAAGYRAVDTPEQADMVILNTCHIREKAAEKVYSELGRLKPLKTQNSDMIIGVAGCVAQAEGAEIIARAPVVDMVFGPQTFQQLPDMLTEIADSVPPVKNRVWFAQSFPRRKNLPLAPGTPQADFARADRFCDGAGRLRQVLQFLCRALYARRGSFARHAGNHCRGRSAGQ